MSKIKPKSGVVEGLASIILLGRDSLPSESRAVILK